MSSSYPTAKPPWSDRLADSVEGNHEPARTIGVIGASGGVGASTFAAALGLAAARRGHDALLIDLDTSGGGVELVVGVRV